MFCDTKEELTETYLLVKGGHQDLTPALAPALIGIERNDFGFEALYSVKSDMILPPGLLTARPSIDQIIVHFIENEKK